MSGTHPFVEEEVEGEAEQPFDPYSPDPNEWDDYADPGCLPKEPADEEK